MTLLVKEACSESHVRCSGVFATAQTPAGTPACPASLSTFVMCGVMRGLQHELAATERCFGATDTVAEHVLLSISTERSGRALPSISRRTLTLLRPKENAPRPLCPALMSSMPGESSASRCLFWMSSSICACCARLCWSSVLGNHESVSTASLAERAQCAGGSERAVTNALRRSRWSTVCGSVIIRQLVAETVMCCSFRTTGLANDCSDRHETCSRHCQRAAAAAYSTSSPKNFACKLRSAEQRCKVSSRWLGVRIVMRTNRQGGWAAVGPTTLGIQGQYSADLPYMANVL